MSTSEKRGRTGRLPPIRCYPEEEAKVRKKAAERQQSVGQFMLDAALARTSGKRSTDRLINELLQLGRQQRELFMQGSGALQAEYQMLMTQITSAIKRLGN